MKKIKLLLFLLIFTLPLFAQKNISTLAHETAKSTNLLLVSDAGRNGYYDQKPIAEEMGKAAELLGPEAVISGGDMFHYLGVGSTQDPLWLTNFEYVYSHPELQLHWYPVLGNHEYRGNTQAVLDYRNVSRRWTMPARYYSKRFRIGGKYKGVLEMFFIDTPPLIDKYRKNPEVYPDAHLQDMNKQLCWLDSALAASDADWKVVIGHHPIYAETDKSITERQDMQHRVLPILDKHGVDMYLCGHIHNFQYIRKPDSNIDFVVLTSGARSRQVHPIDGTQYCNPSTGFALLSAQKDSLKLYLIDKNGNVLYELGRSHQK